MKSLFEKLTADYGFTDYTKILPCRKLVIANDKISEYLFSRGETSFKRLVSNGCSITEKETKKYGKVITNLEFRPQNPRPLNQFDRACLDAVMSQYMAGNEFITVGMIYRTLTGKNNRRDNRADPTPAQRAVIRESVDNMAFSNISIDMKEAKEYLRYVELKNIKTPIFKDHLIPCAEIKDVFIGGVIVDAVYKIRDVSPLYRIAKIKKQLLTCDMKVLNVPGQHNGTEIIGVKWYILQRILECKIHRKNMPPVVTFADVFDKCKLENLGKMKRSRFNGYIVAFMEHLVNCKLISGFEISTYKNQPVSLKFSF